MKNYIAYTIIFFLFFNANAQEVVDTATHAFDITRFDTYKNTAESNFLSKYWTRTSKVKKFYHNGFCVQGLSNFFVVGTVEIDNPIVIKKEKSYAYYITSDSIYRKYNGKIKDIEKDPNCYFAFNDLNPILSFRDFQTETKITREFIELMCDDYNTQVILKGGIEYIGRYNPSPDFILLILVRGDMLLYLTNGQIDKYKIKLPDIYSYYSCVIPCYKKQIQP